MFLVDLVDNTAAIGQDFFVAVDCPSEILVVEFLTGLGDRRFAVFVKSLRNALPLDIVTVVASLAAPDPIRKGRMPDLAAALLRTGYTLRASRIIRMRSGESFRQASKCSIGSFCFSGWRLSLPSGSRAGSPGTMVSLIGFFVSLVAASALTTGSVCIDPF
jgi:hypothetical protein